MRTIAVICLFFGLLTSVSIAAPAPEVYIHLVGTTDANINGTVLVTGKKMTIDICCVKDYQYALQIAQGTCAAPSSVPGAIIEQNRAWRFSAGHLRASVPSIFPIHSSTRYHLFLYDMGTASPKPAPVSCADVPDELMP